MTRQKWLDYFEFIAGASVALVGVLTFLLFMRLLWILL